MRNVNVVWREFPRHALGEAPQREFAHRERCRLSVPFDAGRRTGKQNGAMTLLQHPLRGTLSNEKTTVCGNIDHVGDGGWIEIDKSTANPGTGVIDDGVESVPGLLCGRKSSIDILGLCHVASDCRCTGLCT